NQKSTLNITVQSRTILTGLDLMNASVERRVSLKHLKALIFSEALARQGLGYYLGPLLRYPEFRRNTFMAVSRDKPEKLIEHIRPIMEANPAKYIELLVTSQSYIGFSPFAQVHHFYNDMKSASIQPSAVLLGIAGSQPVHHNSGAGGVNEGDYLAGQLPRKGGGDIEMIGAAVFRGDRLAGELNGEETVLLNMLKGQFKESLFAFPDPEKPERFITMRVLAQSKPQVRVGWNKGQAPEIQVQVPLEAEITSIQSGINYERPERLPRLEAAFNRMVEEKTAELIRKSQEDFQADIFGFGFQARHLAATWPQWRQMDWLAAYPDAAVSITFNTHIRRIGLLRETSPVVKE
ncbi:Ger(x)C family spore germination protein, partial [Desulfotomaculum copahuensis]